jgi:hypothetical protein
MQRLYGRDANKRTNKNPAVANGTMPHGVWWGAHVIQLMYRSCIHDGPVV